ncbi:low affinity iron permease family protein [Nocardia sp. NPDC058379]|uniref:low affinity iron permease family protein n=1 Tax=unclassified Nocardia TaxID=2637762 RepID=UPI003656E7E4
MDARRFATTIPDAATHWAGTRWAWILVLVAAIATVVVGACTHFPSWWQTTVYTGAGLTSVVMLFLLQHTTNRANHAVLIKLDELVRATSGARADFLDLEDQQVHEQEELHDRLITADDSVERETDDSP